MELKDRVTELIRRFYDGNVLGSARAIGMPANTLDRIARGVTPNPRAGALSKIAEHFDTTVDWLLTGRGDAPWESAFFRRNGADPERAVSWFQWSKAAKAFSPEHDDLSLLLLQLLAASGQFVISVGQGAARATGRSRNRDRRWLERLVSDVGARSAREWSYVLSSLNDRYGASAVAESLSRHFDDLAVGFHPFLMWLARRGKVPTGDSLVRELLAFEEERLAQKDKDASARGRA